jgi:tRNA U34 5-carboxymethylaminomethyl modifying enzyme MnmG/GidA
MPSPREFQDAFDVITVAGAGHAGCEAALVRLPGG